MKPRKIKNKTSLSVNESTEGETIETKIERIVNNKEPIKDGAPLIYTERAEGVKAGYNIKTDRWEIAIDGTDKIQKSLNAKRENKAGKVIDMTKENAGGEPIQGTDNKL